MQASSSPEEGRDLIQETGQHIPAPGCSVCVCVCVCVCVPICSIVWATEQTACTQSMGSPSHYLRPLIPLTLSLHL